MNNSFRQLVESVGSGLGHDWHTTRDEDVNKLAHEPNLSNNLAQKIIEHPHTTDESLKHLASHTKNAYSYGAGAELARRKVKGMDEKTALQHLNHGNANEHEVLAIAKKHPHLYPDAIKHRNGWPTAHHVVHGFAKHDSKLLQVVHDTYPNDRGFNHAIKTNNHDQIITFKH